MAVQSDGDAQINNTQHLCVANIVNTLLPPKRPKTKKGCSVGNTRIAQPSVLDRNDWHKGLYYKRLSGVGSPVNHEAIRASNLVLLLGASSR